VGVGVGRGEVLTESQHSRVRRIRHKQRSCDVFIKEQILRCVDGSRIQVEKIVIRAVEIFCAGNTVTEENIESRIAGPIVV